MFNENISNWEPVIWHGDITNIDGEKIYTDGINYYYNKTYDAKYILDVGTRTWSVYQGDIGFKINSVFTDGVNYYAINSYYGDVYALDVEKYEWSQIGGSLGLPGSLTADHFWTDGINLYYTDNEYGTFVFNQNKN